MFCLLNGGAFLYLGTAIFTQVKTLKTSPNTEANTKNIYMHFSLKHLHGSKEPKSHLLNVNETQH